MAAKYLLPLLLLSAAAFAQTTQSGNQYIGAGLAVGLAGLGAGIGVGIAGAAAISALVEKPQERVWYLIFVALAEAIAIYGLLISFILAAK
ncbi:H+-transporting ATP synthase subunit C (atpC) [Thermoproteus uzoniensis 768-20]|uniref:H+-transporting ATP synthase subunit C (AtpC) n=1 Tax=Thermoproteus uzoniensis (strain 768-20) TaxID=999630 RepID=F2L391_THEU7|nr:ATP synthase subunit C [Thermoproteus uzoniensis]AEA11950.1 H+-transporting ATP synthase subunit C (atpC) [Thermoproteus uzoniensis 768-20]